jgi:hypothetical protein
MACRVQEASASPPSPCRPPRSPDASPSPPAPAAQPPARPLSTPPHAATDPSTYSNAPGMSSSTTAARPPHGVTFARPAPDETTDSRFTPAFTSAAPPGSPIRFPPLHRSRVASQVLSVKVGLLRPAGSILLVCITQRVCCVPCVQQGACCAGTCSGSRSRSLSPVAGLTLQGRTVQLVACLLAIPASCVLAGVNSPLSCCTDH